MSADSTAVCTVNKIVLKAVFVCSDVFSVENEFILVEKKLKRVFRL